MLQVGENAQPEEPTHDTNPVHDAPRRGFVARPAPKDNSHGGDFHKPTRGHVLGELHLAVCDWIKKEDEHMMQLISL